MKRKPNPCIVCQRPVSSLLYTALYCGVCRAAVAELQREAKRAVVSANLPNPGEFECVDCGKPATDYDHRYYALPVEVEPVCSGCNTKRGPALDVVALVRDRVAAVSEPHQPAREAPEKPQTLQEILDAAERRFIQSALASCRGNATAAARSLRISYRSMRYRMDRLGISKPDK